MFKNENIELEYKKILEAEGIKKANYIILNSLAILGDKKVIVEAMEELDDFSIKRINRYKYPERLASFMKITREKTEEWKSFSFIKLAYN